MWITIVHDVFEWKIFPMSNRSVRHVFIEFYEDEHDADEYDDDDNCDRSSSCSVDSDGDADMPQYSEDDRITRQLRTALID